MRLLRQVGNRIIREDYKVFATWHSDDYDIPVVVKEYLGVVDGEKWFLVESKQGKTGVPHSRLKDIRTEKKQ